MDDALKADRLRYNIRKEHELIAGWRRRHGVSKNPEERSELEQWAANAKASIRALNAELDNLAAKQAA